MRTIETPIMIAKPSRFLVIGLLTTGLVVIALALVTYYYGKSGHQLFATSVSIMMVCVGLITLYQISTLNILTLYADRVVVKSILGLSENEIYHSEVTSWIEIKKSRGKSTKTFNHLTLYTENGQYIISSEIYADYSFLKQSLTRGKQRNFEEERKWYRRDNLILAIFYLITGLVTFHVAYHTYTQVDLQFVLVCVLGMAMAAISGYYFRKEV